MKKKDYDADVAMCVLMGVAMGGWLTAVMCLTIFVFFDEDTGSTWSPYYLVVGLVALLVSVVLVIITMLYWHYIVAKTPVLFKRFLGFAMVLGIVVALLGVHVSLCVTNLVESYLNIQDEKQEITTNW